MTPPPPSLPSPDNDSDLALIALRRAKENARRYRSVNATTSAHQQVRRRRAPSVPIGQVMLEMLTERGLCHPVGASVIVRWTSVVGPDVARHVIPAGFDEDTATLTLRCDSSAWLTQALLLRDALLKRLNNELGPGSVHQLRLVKSSIPAVPRHAPAPEATHAVVRVPRVPLPDPAIEAAQLSQAQRMPRGAAPPTGRC
ncbi:DciA family protein [Streptomyces collinus]|uniref:DciA family protein n=1 Tax=Streptomyces collinus TaxID=42684 RepID=UPI0036537043